MALDVCLVGANGGEKPSDSSCWHFSRIMKTITKPVQCGKKQDYLDYIFVCVRRDFTNCFIVDTTAAVPCFWCCSGSKQSTDIWGSSIAGWWRDPQKTSPWRKRGMPTTYAVHYCRRAPQKRTGWQRLPSWRLRLKSPGLYYYWYCLSS